MGFDTSFHPVDLELIESRVLPYLAGHGEDDAIDDLVGRAVSLRKTRFRAKAWALGVLEHKPDGFDSELHLWGRPFFIVGSDRIAEDVQRYLAAADGGVDALAREMIARLDPALVGRIEPDQSGTLPGDDALAQSLGSALRILRAAAVALRAGERTVRVPDGREFDAAELLTREAAYNVLDFAAALLPGWMSRGYTWPTRLYSDAGVRDEGFTAPTALTGLLREEFPGLDWPVPSGTIVQNYMVGGLVRAADVPEARAHLGRHRERLDCEAVDLQKIDEAMGVAEQLGVAFCEATEIYSGFEGNLN
ncbi:hypothetical protein Acsp03_53100 [Actinomadura sp. NBRC 104412]|uniref:hypothetical protein n=1 Tax=Actinomadura sp. NBRC 104412 TaxID=3032203 RepID=UPI0024A1F14B|nr:hypothetical protein [Actinomadura sp. NBRC 104412]GLZ07844.1 hypothetical protein Acsp03_53100 [Actinomadura sp. NBRC 104412]